MSVQGSSICSPGGLRGLLGVLPNFIPFEVGIFHGKSSSEAFPNGFPMVFLWFGVSPSNVERYPHGYGTRIFLPGTFKGLVYSKGDDAGFIPKGNLPLLQLQVDIAPTPYCGSIIDHPSVITIPSHGRLMAVFSPHVLILSLIFT